MKLLYRTKNVYGKELNYPANPTAETIAKIHGAKTLPDTILLLCRDELKYEVERVI